MLKNDVWEKYSKEKTLTDSRNYSTVDKVKINQQEIIM